MWMPPVGNLATAGNQGCTAWHSLRSMRAFCSRLYRSVFCSQSRTTQKRRYTWSTALRVPLSMTLNVSTWSFSTSECGTGSAKNCSCTSSFGVNVGSSGFIEELSLETSTSCCMGATAVCSRGNGVMQSHSKHSSRCWRKADCYSLRLTLSHSHRTRGDMLLWQIGCSRCHHSGFE